MIVILDLPCRYMRANGEGVLVIVQRYDMGMKPALSKNGGSFEKPCVCVAQSLGMVWRRWWAMWDGRRRRVSSDTRNRRNHYNRHHHHLDSLPFQRRGLVTVGHGPPVGPNGFVREF